jgi:hypothetical protein
LHIVQRDRLACVLLVKAHEPAAIHGQNMTKPTAFRCGLVKKRCDEIVTINILRGWDGSGTLPSVQFGSKQVIQLKEGNT